MVSHVRPTVGSRSLLPSVDWQTERECGSKGSGLHAGMSRSFVKLQWFQSRWHNPEKVVYMDPHIKVMKPLG